MLIKRVDEVALKAKRCGNCGEFHNNTAIKGVCNKKYKSGITLAGSLVGFMDEACEYHKRREYTWKRKGGYEVSSKGDQRFSAFYARLRDGRTIEEAYQLDVKGYRCKGNDPMLGKGKPPLDKTVDLWAEYLKLWEQWAAENPTMLLVLRSRADQFNGVLSDMFAKTEVNQARALVVLLNRLTEQEG